MTIQDTIKSRRSVRKFLDKPISDEIINDLLTAAQQAPSGGNAQTHIFGIVRENNVKQALAKAAGKQMWIAEAPIVIACCVRLDKDFKSLPKDDFGLEVNRLRWGDKLLDYLTAYDNWHDMALLLANAAPLIPTEHIFLTAVSYGLSACFVGWLDIKAAGSILSLPNNIACLFLLPVGYPSEEPGCKELKPLSEISFYDTYNK